MKSSKVIRIACLAALASMFMVACFGGFSPKDLKGGLAKQGMPDDTKEEFEKYGEKLLMNLTDKERAKVFNKLFAYLTSDAWDFEKLGQLGCHISGLVEDEKNTCVDVREKCLKDVESDSEIKQQLKDDKDKIKSKFLAFAKNSFMYPKDLIMFTKLLNKASNALAEIDCDMGMSDREKKLRKAQKEAEADAKTINERIKTDGGKGLDAELRLLHKAFKNDVLEGEDGESGEAGDGEDDPGKGDKKPKKSTKKPKKSIKEKPKKRGMTMSEAAPLKVVPSKK